MNVPIYRLTELKTDLMSVLSRLCCRVRSCPSSVSRQEVRQEVRQFRQLRGRSGLRGDRVVVQPEVSPPSPPSWSDLVRPGLFTVLFTGGSLAGCAVWQYERMRRQARQARMFGLSWPGGRRKVGVWREEMRQWWAGLTDGQRLFWPLCGANLLVFAGWRVPALQSFMMKWFTCGPSGPAKCLPMLLSAFSHYAPLHLACNMYVLHSFISPAVKLLGPEQFLAVYLSSGVVSSYCSMIYKVAVRSSGLSLGASGAICCVLGMFGCFLPDTKLSIVFLPMITFSAGTAIKGMMALDTAGMLLRWSYLDHAAHLGGLLSGVAWAHYGTGEVWARREALVTAWHRLRTGRD